MIRTYKCLKARASCGSNSSSSSSSPSASSDFPGLPWAETVPDAMLSVERDAGDMKSLLPTGYGIQSRSAFRRSRSSRTLTTSDNSVQTKGRSRSSTRTTIGIARSSQVVPKPFVPQVVSVKLPHSFATSYLWNDRGWHFIYLTCYKGDGAALSRSSGYMHLAQLKNYLISTPIASNIQGSVSERRTRLPGGPCSKSIYCRSRRVKGRSEVGKKGRGVERCRCSRTHCPQREAQAAMGIWKSEGGNQHTDVADGSILCDIGACFKGDYLLAVATDSL